MKKEAVIVESFTFLKGSLYQCLAFWVICCISIFSAAIIILFHGKLDTLGIVAICSMSLLLVAMIISCLNFFGVSDRSLVVKNHCVPGYKRRFRFSDIKEVLLDDGEGWSSISLIIILRTTNEQDKEISFYGLTLKDEQWLALYKELEKRRVNVSNYVLMLE